MRGINIKWSELASLLEIRTSSDNVVQRPMSQEVSSPPNKRFLWAIWDCDEVQSDPLVRLIVVPDDEHEEFLAWAVTFLPRLKPLTGLIRVVPWTLFHAYEMAKKSNTESSWDVIFVAAIMGELMDGGAPARKFLDSVPAAAIESTFFSCIAKSHFKEVGPMLIDHVSESWREVREITGHSPRSLDFDSLSFVAGVLLNLSNRDQNGEVWRSISDVLTAACRGIQLNGEIRQDVWAALGGKPSLSLKEYASLSREMRVEAFESDAKNIVSKRVHPLEAGFLIGYMASLVSSGSTEHSAIVAPFQQIYPTAMVWYFVCNALISRDRFLTDYGYLGIRTLRILRDNRTMTSMPSCDISLNEFRVILRGREQTRLFRRASSSLLRVELAPNITTVVKWPLRSSPTNQLDLFANEVKSQSSSDDLAKILALLRKSVSLAETALGNAAESDSPDDVSKLRKRKKL
jgi:hypothetical protein